MSEPLDELYFRWLYSQVGDPELKDPSRSYWRLARLLFTKEFVWLVPNDDNRIEDGKNLRYEFVDQAGLDDVDLNWVNLGCSMLELMIGLSRRLAFEVEGEPADWFWHLIDNLGLRDHTDTYAYSDGEINHILDRIIWRNYQYSGEGGFFPLRWVNVDQRSVEIWYQLNAYILENFPA